MFLAQEEPVSEKRNQAFHYPKEASNPLQSILSLSKNIVIANVFIPKESGCQEIISGV